MTIINSVKRITPGLGSGTSYASSQNTTTNVGTTNVVLGNPFTPSPISNGFLRIKTVSVVSTGTVALGPITATDGTNTYTINDATTALPANALMDVTIEFNLDINAISITVPIVAGTANSVHDVEVIGNP